MTSPDVSTCCSSGLAQATSHVMQPLKIQAQAKAWESGLSKLKLEPQATLSHSFGSGSARLLLAGIGWLSAHGPGREITMSVTSHYDFRETLAMGPVFLRPAQFPWTPRPRMFLWRVVALEDNTLTWLPLAMGRASSGALSRATCCTKCISHSIRGDELWL